VTKKSPIEEYAEFRDKIWEDPHFKAFYAALLELHTETDRGIALVITSFLDKMLSDTLRAYLIENDGSKALLSGFNAPLGTFSSRIAACHALGLISDDEAAQINILRRVRNEFAHEIGVKFDDGRVKDLCNNLRVGEDGKPRDKFTRSGISILIPLLSRPKEVAAKRLAWGGWSQWTKGS
jgi:mannitol operon repressor